MAKIAITGASGFVGSNLKDIFHQNGHDVIAIKREDLKDIEILSNLLDGCDAVVNLAGANIISRWSEEYKNLLYSSRIGTTRNLFKAIEKTKNKPEIFISTSAVGIYDNQSTYDEENFNYGDDFLAKLCKDWEKEALKVQTLGIRTVIFRFGIVLGDGGALGKMLLPFKLGLGGTIGDGKQVFSFIHIDDLKNAFEFALEHDNIEGIYNMTAPTPTTNYGLTKALGKSLHRPTILPVPAFILDLIFSEGSKVLTDGQSAVPKRLLDAGFEFKFQNIEDTIDNLV
ncbi:MAG: TIGR01777 family oxidoreductase [Arcobacteraceae bacterium]|nr:TIGR01777 family oxidoreductase [Arcobacteraceae bacterium]